LNRSDCQVPHCHEPHHARGLCDAHYQQWRRSGIAPLPEIEAKHQLEDWIDQELRLGSVPYAWMVVAGWAPDWMLKTCSVFKTDAERRAAWEDRRDGILPDYIDRKGNRGHRPWAWWAYDSGRPELWGRPRVARRSIREMTKLNHEHELEVIRHMAERGFLTEAELEEIRAKGEAARQRIGAGRERKAALSPDYGGDKERTALADVLEEVASES
jgi:hypothetical protein